MKEYLQIDGWKSSVGFETYRNISDTFQRDVLQVAEIALREFKMYWPKNFNKYAFSSLKHHCKAIKCALLTCILFLNSLGTCVDAL